MVSLDRSGSMPSSDLTRRTLLARITTALGVLIGVALGGSVGRYFLSPAWKLRREGWVETARLSELQESSPVKINYVQRKQDGWTTTEGLRSVWLLREKDSGVIAFDPRCTHLGCPYRWDDARGEFLCPCHSAVFDRAGKVVSGPPPRPLDRFPVRIERDVIMIIPASAGGNINELK